MRPASRLRSCERAYWEIDFPDRGQEDYASSGRQLADQLEEVLLGAVTRRLRADVPVVSYLSGGVDSSLVVALASQVRGKPIPTFTIRITRPDLDESERASLIARHIGVEPVVVIVRPEEVLRNYPALIRAAEGPVIDTSCAALLMLAREVHARGYKVALTGEGADEWLAGYPWHKVNWLLSWLDVIPGLPLSQSDAPAFRAADGRAEVRLEFRATRPGGDRRTQRLAGHLRPDEHVQAALLQPVDDAVCSKSGLPTKISVSIWTACGAGIRSTASWRSAPGFNWRDCCSMPRATAWP